MDILSTPNQYLFELKTTSPAEAKRLWRRKIKEKWEYECAYCGADTDLTIDHVVPRAKGGADFTNNRWTVPSGYAGNYYLSGQVFGDFTDTSGERGDPSIRINGTERIAARLRTGANGGSSTYLVSGIFNLNVGDHVQLYFYQDSGSSQNTDANQNYTWLVGTRLDDA